jgi:hypothetical protein
MPSVVAQTEVDPTVAPSAADLGESSTDYVLGYEKDGSGQIVKKWVKVVN